MPLASIFAGAPFRASLYAIALFVAVQLVVGTVLHRRLGATMLLELEEQILAELVLFRDIFEHGGQAELVGAIADMESLVIAGPRVAGLFGADDEPLAGVLDVAPDFLGWSTRPVTRGSVADGADHRLRVERWSDLTIVLGRDTEVIRRALDALVRALVLAGFTVTVASLAIGSWLSRGTRERLAHMAAALDRFGRGDMGARLPSEVGDWQIESISTQINGYLDELARLVDDTRNTIGNVAHDLRTPLGRASMKLQEAAHAVDTDPRAATLVGDALGELDTLGATFETILRIGRIRTSDAHDSFETVELGALTDEIAETFAPVLEDAGQRLVLAPGEGSRVTVRADRQMIAQLLANLVTNVVRHCPSGTEVTIGHRRTAAGTVEVTVSDDGPGVPVDRREEVLRPFVRLDASRGSGLGLALADAVARRHGASLCLGDAGPGLRVVLSFPHEDGGRASDGGRP